MKLHLASLPMGLYHDHKRRFPASVPSVLRSFGVPNGDDHLYFHTNRDEDESLIYDSGTFTRNNPGASFEAKSRVTIEGYKEQLLRIKDYCDLLANFDENWSEDCFDTNLFNQKWLESFGLNVFPVIHNIITEPAYYIKQGYKFIAIGSALIRNIDIIAPVVWKLHKSGIKVHLFGTTSFPILAVLPVYSCDSASWAKTGAFGEMMWWNPYLESWDKTDKIYMEVFYHLSDRSIKYFSTYRYRTELEEYLWETFRFTHDDFLGEDKANNIHLVNTHYYIELERRVNEEHRKRGILVD